MFYEFNQNNSGGSFVTDDKLCHRLFIEADSITEAIEKAEDLGCYWNGVSEGIDCPCCGDRWYEPWSETKIPNNYKAGGYGCETKEEWLRKYGRYNIIEQPTMEIGFWKEEKWTGKISFKDIEEYAQFLANEYGWTSPDARIYYKNGDVKEIDKEV